MCCLSSSTYQAPGAGQFDHDTCEFNAFMHFGQILSHLQRLALATTDTGKGWLHLVASTIWTTSQQEISNNIISVSAKVYNNVKES